MGNDDPQPRASRSGFSRMERVARWGLGLLTLPLIPLGWLILFAHSAYAGAQRRKWDTKHTPARAAAEVRLRELLTDPTWVAEHQTRFAIFVRGKLVGTYNDPASWDRIKTTVEEAPDWEVTYFQVPTPEEVAEGRIEHFDPDDDSWVTAGP